MPKHQGVKKTSVMVQWSVTLCAQNPSLSCCSWWWRWWPTGRHFLCLQVLRTNHAKHQGVKKTSVMVQWSVTLCAQNPSLSCCSWWWRWWPTGRHFLCLQVLRTNHAKHQGVKKTSVMVQWSVTLCAQNPSLSCCSWWWRWWPTGRHFLCLQVLRTKPCH